MAAGEWFVIVQVESHTVALRRSVISSGVRRLKVRVGAAGGDVDGITVIAGVRVGDDGTFGGRAHAAGSITTVDLLE